MANSSKYAGLTDHLKAQAERVKTITLSFGQLNSILGFPLPKSALDYRPWWANQRGAHPQSRAWMDAGYLVESVNLGSRLVRFSRKLGPGTVLVKKPSAPAKPTVLESSPQAKYEVNGCHLTLDELKTSLAEVGRLAHRDIAARNVELQWTPAPHKRPSLLPAGTQGVYCFFLGEHCLKVGKAGPQSSARFANHHYGLNAPSTLARSILAGRDRVAQFLREELKGELHTTDAKAIGRWIEKHTSRLNVLIPAEAGPHALSLVEAFLHCRLEPLFEGHG